MKKTENVKAWEREINENNNYAMKIHD